MLAVGHCNADSWNRATSIRSALGKRLIFLARPQEVRLLKEVWLLAHSTPPGHCYSRHQVDGNSALKMRPSSSPVCATAHGKPNRNSYERRLIAGQALSRRFGTAGHRLALSARCTNKPVADTESTLKRTGKWRKRMVWQPALAGFPYQTPVLNRRCACRSLSLMRMG